jgi:phosphatidate cytidylyltransferase
MLRKRVITALWGIPLLIVAVWFDEPLPWFTVLAAVWGLLAVLEFYRMVAVSRARSLTFFGLIWTLLFLIYPHFLPPHFDYEFPVPLLSLLLTSSITLSLLILVLHPKREGTFTDWAWAMAGVLYVGWLLSYLVALRLDAGRDWVFLALFATFGSDTAAFFLGRALGRHRLAPRISPAKTWEGAAAGLLGAVIISLLFTLSTPLQLPLSYGQVILLGILVSVFGQFGDLAESLLKRHMGVKESGSLMPGHGGLLDRMDSVVFAGIVVYLYYTFVVL